MLDGLPPMLTFAGYDFWLNIVAIDPKEAEGYSWMACYQNGEMDAIPNNFYTHGHTPEQAVARLREILNLHHLFT